MVCLITFTHFLAIILTQSIVRVVIPIIWFKFHSNQGKKDENGDE